ncbi:MAG TPA: hypothetical protein VIB08_06025 [Thermoanaerobaculia bacterium]
MLERLKASRAVRTALVAAAILSIVGAFGLHPEPFAVGPSGSLPGVSALKVSGATHACLACLTHGVALASPLSGIVADLSDPGVLLPGSEIALRSLLSAGRRSGRSPPARS